jgi:hypothetical protein
MIADHRGLGSTKTTQPNDISMIGRQIAENDIERFSMPCPPPWPNKFIVHAQHDNVS